MKFTLALFSLLFSLAFVCAASPEPVTLPIAAAAASGFQGESIAPRFSADGSKILFLSSAPNLTLEAPSNGSMNLYQYDLASGTIELISVGPEGAPGHDSSGLFQTSLDGKVVFDSLATNLTSHLDPNGSSDVFLRSNRVNVLVSISTNGARTGFRTSANASISSDGGTILFQTLANNLVTRDTNRFEHLLFYKVADGSKTLIPPTAVFGGSFILPQQPLSADGQRAIFTVTTPSPVRMEVYLHDAIRRTNIWVSRNALAEVKKIDPARLAAFSEKPFMSADGKFALFWARGDQSRVFSVLHHEVEAGLTRRVSSNGVPVALSADGQKALFLQCSNYVSAITATNLVLWNAQSSALISLTNFVVSSNRTFNALMGSVVTTPDLQSIAFLNYNSVLDVSEVLLINGWDMFVVASLPFNELALAEPTLSPDGRYVAYATRINARELGDSNSAADLFLWDKQTEEKRLVSARLPLPQSAVAAGHARLSDSPISDDGRFVVFQAHDGNLIAVDTNGFPDIFLKNLVSGHTTLVSLNHSLSGPANGPSASPCISADGRFIAFSSWAEDLVQGDTNRLSDIFVFNRETGLLSLVSKNFQGGPANGNSYNPALSDDGRYLYFLSTANNLMETPDSTLGMDLFQRDLQTGTNERLTTAAAMLSPSNAALMIDGAAWAIYFANSGQRGLNVWTPTESFYNTNYVSSFPAAFAPQTAELFSAAVLAGAKLHLWQIRSNTFNVVCTNCYDPEITADGRFMAYSTTLQPSFGITYRAIHFIDRQTQELRAFGSTNDNSLAPKLSADGRKLFFVAQHVKNVAPGQFHKDLYVADTASGETVLLTPSIRTNLPDTRFTHRYAITPDGQSIVFQSFAPDLIAGDTDQASDIFLLHLSGGAAADSDADGLEDAWEVTYFGNLDQNGTGDADQDGASDLAEFKAGTNPSNNASVFKVLKLENLTSGSVTLLWTAAADRNYQVQYKDVLSDPWVNLSGSISIQTNTGSIQDSDRKPQRFYRVLLAP